MRKSMILLTEDAGRADGQPIYLLFGLRIQQNIRKCITNIGSYPDNMGKMFIRFRQKPVILNAIVNKVPETEFKES